MYSFTLTQKTIPNLTHFHNTVKTFISQFEGFLVDGDVVTVVLNTAPTQSIIDAIEAITPPSMQQLDQIITVITNARAFGRDLMIRFAAENVLLGITQDGMTSTVRVVCSDVIECLSTGSLYDAIVQIKAIPLESRDIKYLTNARLLNFVNLIEDYLHVTRSTAI